MLSVVKVFSHSTLCDRSIYSDEQMNDLILMVANFFHFVNVQKMNQTRFSPLAIVPLNAFSLVVLVFVYISKKSVSRMYLDVRVRLLFDTSRFVEIWKTNCFLWSSAHGDEKTEAWISTDKTVPSSMADLRIIDASPYRPPKMIYE